MGTLYNWWYFDQISLLNWKRKRIGALWYFILKNVCPFCHFAMRPCWRFSKQMREQIPKLRESIKDASMTDLKAMINVVTRIEIVAKSLLAHNMWMKRNVKFYKKNDLMILILFSKDKNGDTGVYILASQKKMSPPCQNSSLFLGLSLQFS